MLRLYSYLYNVISGSACQFCYRLDTPLYCSGEGPKNFNITPIFLLLSLQVTDLPGGGGAVPPQVVCSGSLGSNSFDQLTPPTALTDGSTAITQMCAGQYHTCAIIAGEQGTAHTRVLFLGVVNVCSSHREMVSSVRVCSVQLCTRAAWPAHPAGCVDLWQHCCHTDVRWAVPHMCHHSR